MRVKNAIKKDLILSFAQVFLYLIDITLPMVEIGSKYKIGTRRFGLINWIGTWALYKKEVLRFLIVWMQTIFSPLISALLFLSKTTG